MISLGSRDLDCAHQILVSSDANIMSLSRLCVFKCLGLRIKVRLLHNIVFCVSVSVVFFT